MSEDSTRTSKQSQLIAAGRAWVAGAGGGRMPTTRDRVPGVSESTVRRWFSSWREYVGMLPEEPRLRWPGELPAEGVVAAASVETVRGVPVAAEDAHKVRAIRELLGVKSGRGGAGTDPGVGVAVGGALHDSAASVNHKLVLVIPDIHFPHQDDTALAVVREAIRVLRPGRVLFLGDVMDCEVFSFHDKGTVAEARVYDYRESEVAPARDLIDWCLKWGGRVVYVEGNHEFRCERWAVRSGIGGMAIHDLISPKRLLSEGRSSSEFTWIDYVAQEEPIAHYRVTESGSLIAVHGWSFSVHAAAVHLARSRSRSVVFGHIHRSQSVVSRDAFTGRVLHAWSPGCLTKLQPIYGLSGLPTDWIHGFSLVYCGSDGVSFSPYNCVIEGGRTVLPDGRQLGA